MSKWYIYGKAYDLSKFIDIHPGGKTILEVTKNHEADITPMFEAYHAFADMELIQDLLNVYEINNDSNNEVDNELDNKIEGKEMMYTFEDNGFYKTCLRRVRTAFGDNNSITHKIKANNLWFMKVFMLIFLLYVSAKFYLITEYNIFTILTGILLVGLEFNVLHDASHFALFARNACLNETLSRITNAMIFWNHELWMMHHTFRHHAYTGDPLLDPDTIHLEPYCRKTPLSNKNLYWKINNYILPFITLFLLFIFPGMLVGQIYSYWLLWRQRGYLWNMKYNNIDKERKIYENIIMIAVILLHIYNGSIVSSLLFIMTLNIMYTICIIPDHDTYSTIKLLDEQNKLKDWGEMQVRHAANFQIHKQYDLFHHIFGGINYQIEHHLFPSMCHVHYPKISKIVENTCLEFNIPYTKHENAFTALADFVRSIITIN